VGKRGSPRLSFAEQYHNVILLSTLKAAYFFPEKERKPPRTVIEIIVF
jgi:hypothetical protein